MTWCYRRSRDCLIFKDVWAHEHDASLFALFAAPLRDLGWDWGSPRFGSPHLLPSQGHVEDFVGITVLTVVYPPWQLSAHLPVSCGHCRRLPALKMRLGKWCPIYTCSAITDN